MTVSGNKIVINASSFLRSETMTKEIEGNDKHGSCLIDKWLRFSELQSL